MKLFDCEVKQVILWFALCAEYGSLKPENFAGARDMDTAIFDVRTQKECLQCINGCTDCVCMCSCIIRLARRSADEARPRIWTPPRLSALSRKAPQLLHTLNTPVPSPNQANLPSTHSSSRYFCRASLRWCNMLMMRVQLNRMPVQHRIVQLVLKAKVVLIPKAALQPKDNNKLRPPLASTTSRTRTSCKHPTLRAG